MRRLVPRYIILLSKTISGVEPVYTVSKYRIRAKTSTSLLRFWAFQDSL
jgi:hypothetical protein